MWINTVTEEYPYGVLFHFDLSALKSLYITDCNSELSDKKKSEEQLLSLHVELWNGEHYSFSGNEKLVNQCHSEILDNIVECSDISEFLIDMSPFGSESYDDDDDDEDDDSLEYL